MDHGEEQDMELQALEAIYMEDFTREAGASPPSFELSLVPETGGEDSHVSLALKVTYTALYPEEAPELSCRPLRGFTPDQTAVCEALLREAAASDELLGQAMVYMLAEKAQEWMAERNVPENRDMHTEMMKRLEMSQAAANTAAQTSAAAGAAGQCGAAGSWRIDADAKVGEIFEDHMPVDATTFAAWRNEFDAEQQRLREVHAAAAAASAGKQGGGGEGCLLTGRQIFEHGGGALLASDAGALAEGEEDMMAVTREEMELDEVGEAGGGGDAVASLLDNVDNEDLFDEEDDQC